MRLVIDMQGFRIENNKFIVKEFAAYDGFRISHYIFKAPFPLKMLPPDLYRQAHWLMKNHHCIDWNSGFTPLHQFSNIIQQLSEEAEFLYVKGREKAQYIKRFSLAPVIELDETPKLQVTHPRCMYHSSEECYCALSNVYNLYETFLMK